MVTATPRWMATGRPVGTIAASGRAQQRGMMLIESLISLVVFSIGVLGLVTLQAQSIRHVSDTQYRGEAIFLANSLASQMWGDDRTSSNPAYLASNYGHASNGAGYRVFAEAARSLPGAGLSANAPQVSVADGPTTSSKVVTITVFWQLPGEPSPHNYSTTAVIGRNS